MTQHQPQQQPQHNARIRIDDRCVRLPDFLPFSSRAASRTAGRPDLDTRRIVWLLSAIQTTLGVLLGMSLGQLILILVLSRPQHRTAAPTPPAAQLAQEVR